MDKKVEIYSRSNCSYCDMAMNFFDSKGIKYEVYNADDPQIFNEMLERNPAARTVPVSYTHLTLPTTMLV